MATATKKTAAKASAAPSSTGTKSTRSRSSSSGSTSTKAKSSDTLAKKIAADIHAKRDAYDNPPVDTPVPLSDAVGEAEGVDGKDKIVVAFEGPTATVSIGGNSVTLDREGVLALQRHANRAGSNV